MGHAGASGRTIKHRNVRTNMKRKTKKIKRKKIMRKLFKNIWKIFTSFFCFTVYVEDREFSKFDTIKFWATTFSTIAALGFIWRLAGKQGLTVAELGIFSSLAAFSTGLYQYKKNGVDKNTPDNVHTVPANTSFIDNVKTIAGTIKDKLL